MPKWAKNRVVIGLAVFFAVMVTWEFGFKPQFRPMYEQGTALYQKGRYEEALREFSRAYDIAPNELEVVVMMGWANLKLGRGEEAWFYFQRARRLDPRSDEAQIGAMFVAVRRGEKIDRARLEKLRARHPGNPDVEELAKAVR